MREEYLKLYDKDKKLIVKAMRSKNQLYKVIMQVEDTKCLQLVHLKDSSRWHARLGHVGMENLRTMIDNRLVNGIPKITHEKETCATCLCGKQTRRSLPQASSIHASKVLELVHGDLCGPIIPPTAGRNMYVVLIDDHSQYMWNILMKEKNEACEKFKSFQRIVEQETGHKIETF